MNRGATFFKSKAVIPIGNIVSAWQYEQNANDSVGSNDGILSGGATYITDRAVGNYAVNFNVGSNTVQNLVPDDPSLSFGNGSTDFPFSASLMFNKKFDGNGYNFFHKGNGVFPSEYTIWHTSGTDAEIELRDNSAGSFIRATTTNQLPNVEAHGWRHYCWTYDGSGLATGLKFYFDGNEMACTYTTSGTYTAMENTGDDLYIGRRPTNNNYEVKGYVDEQYLWNVELTDAQVEQLSNRQRRGTDILTI